MRSWIKCIKHVYKEYLRRMTKKCNVLGCDSKAEFYCIWIKKMDTKSGMME